MARVCGYTFGNDTQNNFVLGQNFEINTDLIRTPGEVKPYAIDEGIGNKGYTVDGLDIGI